jgi:hypothetical protein
MEGIGDGPRVDVVSASISADQWGTIRRGRSDKREQVAHARIGQPDFRNWNRFPTVFSLLDYGTHCLSK